MESVGVTKTEDKKEVLMIAARITSRAVSDQDGKLTAFEGCFRFYQYHSKSQGH